MLFFTFTLQWRNGEKSTKVEFRCSKFGKKTAKQGGKCPIFMQDLVFYTLQICHDHPGEFLFNKVGGNANRVTLVQLYEKANNLDNAPEEINSMVDFFIHWLTVERVGCKNHIEKLKLTKKSLQLCIDKLTNTKDILYQALTGRDLDLILENTGIYESCTNKKQKCQSNRTKTKSGGSSSSSSCGSIQRATSDHNQQQNSVQYDTPPTLPKKHENNANHWSSPSSSMGGYQSNDDASLHDEFIKSMPSQVPSPPLSPMREHWDHPQSIPNNQLYSHVWKREKDNADGIWYFVNHGRTKFLRESDVEEIYRQYYQNL